MKALSAFLFAPLELAGASDMLNCVASDMQCAPVELGHWLINKREAQRSFEMVSCRQEAGPLVLSTKLGLQEMADHPRLGRHCGQGLVRRGDEPRAAPLQAGESYQQTEQFPPAQRVKSPIRPRAGTRVNERSESNRRERLGCPAHP